MSGQSDDVPASSLTPEDECFFISVVSAVLWLLFLQESHCVQGLYEFSGINVLVFLKHSCRLD